MVYECQFQANLSTNNFLILAGTFYGCIDKTTIQVFRPAVMGFTFTETLVSLFYSSLCQHRSYCLPSLLI